MTPLVALLVLGVCGASISLARSACAAASPADAAAAQGLFDESKKLVASGQYLAARAKLEESERLDPSVSTEFYLADCYQHLGQTASAWALYLQVASESKAAGRPEREQFARKRADDLAPKLSRLIIVVPAASGSAGLEVKRDGKLVGAGQWGTALPMDPGRHTISATAPNHADWSQTVDVLDGGKTASVEIPPLAPAAAPEPSPVANGSSSPAATPPPPPAFTASEPAADAADSGNHGGSTRKTVAFAVGGAGILAVGVGGVFGGLAISKNNESRTNGCDGNLCNAAGFATRRDAQTDATIANVLVGVGAAALVGGVVLWLTAPSAAEGNRRGSSSHTGLALRATPNGFLLNGIFE